MSDATHVRRVILGTAGHIDHGKTALVERLTGVRTDRLKEEQERGMTIDVGYAAFALPDGTEVGLLDVPGHERLVRTMVAAATAMDLVLLVVAADDGPMPQTREHVAILDVLGVERLVVAITKTDLSDPETIEIVEEEVREMLAPTVMAGAPMIHVSSATGEGLEALCEAIQAAIPPAREDPTLSRVFRMPVLRAFVAAGRGAVVTGIPLSGAVAEGEAIEVLPAGWAGRVRAIQVHRRPETEARAHRRTALALSDVQADRVKRGMVVATKGVLQPVRRLAVALRLLPGAPALEHRDRVRFHVGAAQVVARVHLLEGARVLPGDEAVAELEAFEDVVALPGDRFVLRTENASDTLGGGVVVELLQRRLPRKREGIVRRLKERVDALEDPAGLVAADLASAGEVGARAPDVAARTGLRPALLPDLVEALVEQGKVVRLGHAGDLWIEHGAFEGVLSRVEGGARRLHAKDPALASLPVSAVQTAAGRIAPNVLDAALDHLVRTGRLVREGRDGIRHREHSSSLSDADQRDLERVREQLARGAGQPPAVEDLEADLGLTRPRVLRLLKLLVNRREAFQAGDFYFDQAWTDAAKGRLKAFADEHAGFKPADARSLLDTTRKWVIPFLEALDRQGFCKRLGDKRVVR